MDGWIGSVDGMGSRLVNGVRFNLSPLADAATLDHTHQTRESQSQPARIKYVGACATTRMERHFTCITIFRPHDHQQYLTTLAIDNRLIELFVVFDLSAIF
jgi:hypothetical protein